MQYAIQPLWRCKVQTRSLILGLCQLFIAGASFEACKCNVQAMDAATEEMNRLGGWEFREQAEEMLKRVGLPDSGQLVGSLSGGQKRRVALAAALLANPDLIVADEPTNHMDHQVRSQHVLPSQD